MDQGEVIAAAAHASRPKSPSNEPLATQPSPCNEEEEAAEAAAEMEEFKDCRKDPVLPPITDPTRRNWSWYMGDHLP